jgi:hypothetical protein
VQPLQQAISNFRRTKAEKTTPAKKPPTVFGSGIHFFAFDSFDNVSDEAEDAIVGFFLALLLMRNSCVLIRILDLRAMCALSKFTGELWTLWFSTPLLLIIPI